jgi:uncharacterized membrane protein
VPDHQDADARSRALERMTFFSDAVIAIALTLLALELPVPEADGPRELLRALTGAHGRQYLAFLLAFVLVGASWIAHHQLFSHVDGIDDRLMVLNLLALLGFVLVPWASETLGTAAGGVGLAVFSAVMTVLAASTLALARHVARAGLLRPGTPDAAPRRVRVLTGAQTVMFALSVPLAFLGWIPVVVLWVVVYAGLVAYRPLRRLTAPVPSQRRNHTPRQEP